MRKLRWKNVKITRKTKEVLVIKIGDKDRPPGEADFEYMKEQLEIAAKTGILITHGQVKFETIDLPVDEEGKTVVEFPIE